MMRKSDLSEVVAQKAHLKTRQATEAVASAFEHITDALARGEDIKLKGFATFSVVSRKAHTTRHPLTREKLEVPAYNQIQFRPSKALRIQVAAKS